MGSCVGKLSNEEKEIINIARKNSKNIEEKNMEAEKKTEKKAEKEANKELNEFMKSYMDFSKQTDYILKKSKSGLNVTEEDFKKADTICDIAEKNSDKCNKRYTDDFNNAYEEVNNIATEIIETNNIIWNMFDNGSDSDSEEVDTLLGQILLKQI